MANDGNNNVENNVVPDASNESVTIFSKMSDLGRTREDILGMLDSRRIAESLEANVMETLSIALAAIGNLDQALLIERQVERYGNMSQRDYRAAVQRGEVPEAVQRRLGGQPPRTAEQPARDQPEQRQEEQLPAEPGERPPTAQSPAPGLLSWIQHPVQIVPETSNAGATPTNVQPVENNQSRSVLDGGIEISRFGIRRA